MSIESIWKSPYIQRILLPPGNNGAPFSSLLLEWEQVEIDQHAATVSKARFLKSRIYQSVQQRQGEKLAGLGDKNNFKVAVIYLFVKIGRCWSSAAKLKLSESRKSPANPHFKTRQLWEGKRDKCFVYGIRALWLDVGFWRATVATRWNACKAAGQSQPVFRMVSRFYLSVNNFYKISGFFHQIEEFRLKY